MQLVPLHFGAMPGQQQQGGGAGGGRPGSGSVGPDGGQGGGGLGGGGGGQGIPGGGAKSGDPPKPSGSPDRFGLMVGLDTTFHHVIAQSKYRSILMTASMLHVTNLTPPGSECNDSQYVPCNQSDTPWE
jgi:hypothetical protein